MNAKDWNGNSIIIAKSKGGVKAVAHPFNNLIKTGSEPWPPPEIVQKLYQSRQIRAFSGDDRSICESGTGYYCDLQSLHSEDAITWSVFGTVMRAEQTILETWLADFFEMIQMPDAQTKDAHIFLWRRVPHPDNLVPGGPEIDFGISTSNTLVLGEAKWLSGIGTAQGKEKDKDQIQLRGEYLNKYGHKFYPGRSQFAVLGISLYRDAFKNTVPEGVIFRAITWDEICSLNTHPIADEVRRYLIWKKGNTKENKFKKACQNKTKRK